MKKRAQKKTIVLCSSASFYKQVIEVRDVLKKMGFKVLVPLTAGKMEKSGDFKKAAELYKTFVPGTLSWQDPNNNKAFLDGQISLTANGISVYYAAKMSPDPKMNELAKDIEHSHFPIGPVGKPMELCQITSMMLFAHTKYPNATKELARWLMEAEQYNPWLEKSIGYGAQTLKAYEANPVWHTDPKTVVYGECPAMTTYHGYSGPLGTASAACLADYIVLDMVAEASSGNKTPKEAAARAEARAKRYYKS